MRTDCIESPTGVERATFSALSVNDALDGLARVADREVAVSGTLRFTLEGAALDHYPAAERREAPLGSPRESSSIWLYFGSAALQSYENQFRRWSGGRVIVRGLLKGPAFHGGCGYLSAWPAEIVARSIERMDRPPGHRLSLKEAPMPNFGSQLSEHS